MRYEWQSIDEVRIFSQVMKPEDKQSNVFITFFEKPGLRMISLKENTTTSCIDSPLWDDYVYIERLYIDKLLKIQYLHRDENLLKNFRI